MLTWLRQAPGAANPRNILEHIERLEAIRSIALPEELGRNIHQNHLLRSPGRGLKHQQTIFEILPMSTDMQRW